MSKQQQVQAAPMLATTLAWQARLSEHPLAAPLRSLLAQCSSRLLANFERFLNEMVRPCLARREDKACCCAKEQLGERRGAGSGGAAV